MPEAALVASSPAPLPMLLVPSQALPARSPVVSATDLTPEATPEAALLAPSPTCLPMLVAPSQAPEARFLVPLQAPSAMFLVPYHALEKCGANAESSPQMMPSSRKSPMTPTISHSHQGQAWRTPW